MRITEIFQLLQMSDNNIKGLSMKLILEQATDIEYITEAKEDGKKNLYIEGIFMQYDTPNKNGRYYPKNVMEREVNRYITEKIDRRCAYGELNHPQGPQINLDRVSHLIESLTIRPSGQVYGRAKIVDTDMGRIAKGLIEGGANLGVSTRGLGSLKNGQNGLMEVQDDFRLVTAADIVADPSAPAAFVNGIMENCEWVFNENNGEWVKNIQKEIHSTPKARLDEQKLLTLFNSYLKTL